MYGCICQHSKDDDFTRNKVGDFRRLTPGEATIRRLTELERKPTAMYSPDYK